MNDVDVVTDCLAETRRDEDTCERCGGINPRWYAADWQEVMQNARGIVCPGCFIGMFPPTDEWALRRRTLTDETLIERLASLLARVSDLGSDSSRVASCVIDFLGPEST